MKIAVVQGPFFPVPPLLGGAIERRWLNLTREFVRRGHEVTHYCRAYPGQADSEVVEGVRYVRLSGFERPSGYRQLLWRDFKYALAMRAAIEPADILVTHTFWLPVLAPRNKVKRVCVHIARMPKRQMWLYRRADRLQPVSSAVGEAILAQAPYLKDKVKVFCNGLPSGWCDGSPAATADRDETVLFVGRVHPEKGLDMLLRAWPFVRAKYPGYRLKIVGPFEFTQGGGGAEYQASLEALAKSEGIESSVEFLGPIFDVAQLKSLYDRAAVFVYAPTAESGDAFPMAPIEAMGRGCVPIVSSLPCFKDYVRPGANAFVFENSQGGEPQDLAACIELGITRGDATMRQAGLATGLEFSTEAAADRFLTDFEFLLSRPT